MIGFKINLILTALGTVFLILVVIRKPKRVKVVSVNEKMRQKNNIMERIGMFPEIEEVFIDDFEECKKLFFPLFSINLKLINPNWDEKLFIIQFNEDPYNDETAKYFNEYCKDNMIAFDIIEGKYKFKTDYKYFDLTNDWIEWYEKTKNTYKETKRLYKENNQLPENVFEQIGGQPEWLQDDETPNDPDGNPMTFICRVNTNNYTNDFCGKDIYLFYSRKHNLVVQLYQIT